MTATAPTVKMAACPPVDGDGVDPDNFGPTSSLQATKLFGNNCQATVNSSSSSAQSIKLDGEKAYDAVAGFDESDLRSLLEEVTSQKQSKNDKSIIAQLLIRKEEDALREESGSGEDTIELALGRQKKKRLNCKREHCIGSQESGSSAASRNNTGGSLGSLHNLADPKVPEQKSTTAQGVASRSRAGGSCGNLSKGSFETSGKRKSRRSKEVARASASQREGGSLQNLSKTEAASNESKRLHKSGSLSQVFSEVRIKNRRQKTSSESSGSRLFRRSEDREAGESSEEEVSTIPYQPLIPSSHSSVSGHSIDQVDGIGVGMVGTHWNEDPMSDAASGETTEDDGEVTAITAINARSKLGDSSRHHYLHANCHISECNDTELHSIITHTAHRDVLPTISSDSDVDKPINFSLSKSQDETMISSSTPLLTYPFISILDGKSHTKDEDTVEKRKIHSTKSESGTLEKSSLDENGNPVMTVRSNLSCNSSSSSASASSQPNSSNCLQTSPNSVSKKNGTGTSGNGPSKDISVYDRLKAKVDKKKAHKVKDVIAIEKTPGFRGDASLDTIFKFLGVADNTSSKAKKKNKGKKEDSKDEKESLKKKGGKGGEIDFERFRDYESGLDKAEDSGSGMDSKEKRDDDSNKRSNGRKGKEKKGKKSPGMLRESSSVEDLVSKSKQIENVKDIRKQVTVDDGDISLSDMSSYSHKKTSKVTNRDSLCVKSEFSYDFYKVGDTTLETNLISNSESGDFEVVNRRKGKKSKNGSHTVSQATKYGGSGGWNGNLVSNHSFIEDHRRLTFPRFNGSSNKNSYKTSSHDKTQMNFNEAPRTVHEGTFISEWAGNRNGGMERGFPTTTSAPHSEDSDSDGGDSVHSMPAHTIMPSSTDSTPQTSYANIAKLPSSTSSATKSQGKKGSLESSSISVLAPSEEDSDRANLDDSDLQDSFKNESVSSILDDNFPPLAETISTPASSLSSSKFNDTRNSLENSHNSSIESSGSRKDSKVFINCSSHDINVIEPSRKLSISNSNGIAQFPQNTLIINSTKIVVPPLYNTSLHDACPTSPNSLITNPPPVLKPTVPHSHAAQQVTAGSLGESRTARQTIQTKPPTSVKPPSVNYIPQQFMNIPVCNNLSKEPSDKNKTNLKEGKPTKHNKTSNTAIVENGSSRFRKFDEAVIFTDNAKFDHSISTGIEFGFDMSLENITNLTQCKIVDNNNSKKNVLIEKPVEKTKISSDIQCVNLCNNKKDFSKLFQAPKNDVISYNYEEICRHVSTAWETTLRMLEEDPKNVEYWKATESVEEVN